MDVALSFSAWLEWTLLLMVQLLLLVGVLSRYRFRQQLRQRLGLHRHAVYWITLSGLYSVLSIALIRQWYASDGFDTTWRPLPLLLGILSNSLFWFESVVCVWERVSAFHGAGGSLFGGPSIGNPHENATPIILPFSSSSLRQETQVTRTNATNHATSVPSSGSRHRAPSVTRTRTKRPSHKIGARELQFNQEQQRLAIVQGTRSRQRRKSSQLNLE